jgi:hypothetical protein
MTDATLNLWCCIVCECSIIAPLAEDSDSFLLLSLSSLLKEMMLACKFLFDKLSHPKRFTLQSLVSSAIGDALSSQAKELSS